MRTFSGYVEWDPESGLYVGTVPGVSGAHTQATTLGELRENLREVLELCLEEQVWVRSESLRKRGAPNRDL